MGVFYLLLFLLLSPVLWLCFVGVCSLFVNPRKIYKKNSRFYRFLLQFSTKIGLRLLRVHLHAEGQELVRAGERVLIVSNHLSNYDPIVTWALLENEKLSFVSKEENFKVPFFGRIIRRCCFLPINRQSAKRAVKTVYHAAELIASGEGSVGVYPEGTRSRELRLRPFHNGVLQIAKKAHAPVLVLAVTGTESIHKNTPFRRTDVYLNFLTRIEADTVAQVSTEVLGAEIYQILDRYLETKGY